ncbi:hypothetical protein [Streptomyces xiamenensis]|uniref:hypothetical protein n=1 Tax=Streptomyces xiamenensis TaxID=408015 RepID=UPI003D739DD7
MSAVDVAILPRESALVSEEQATMAEGIFILADLDALGDGSAAACNDDNPYQGS